MFLTWFIIALVLCLPTCIASAMLAEWGGWRQTALWPYLSGAMILLLAGIAATKRWKRDVKEMWLGGLLGGIVGSSALWVLQLWG